MELLIGTGIGFAAGLTIGLRHQRTQLRAVREQWKWSRWRTVCVQRALNRQPSYRRRLP